MCDSVCLMLELQHKPCYLGPELPFICYPHNRCRALSETGKDSIMNRSQGFMKSRIKLTKHVVLQTESNVQVQTPAVKYKM